MKGVYIFAGVMIVLGATAMFYLLLAKLGQKLFAKKDKKGKDE